MSRWARFERWCRRGAHYSAERRALKALGKATGHDFDLARIRYMELTLCTDPERCDHRWHQ